MPNDFKQKIDGEFLKERQQRNRQLSVEKRKAEVEKLIEEIRNAIIQIGYSEFKTTGADLTARQAFEIYMRNYVYGTDRDSVISWYEVENFKLK